MASASIYRAKYRIVSLAAALLFCLLSSAPSLAQGGEDDPVRALSSTDRRIYENYTRVFCRQFFRYEDHDKFVILPNYVRDRDASTGKTYDQVFEEMSYTEVRSSGGIAREYTIRPPRGEVLAVSMVIPSIEVGHYGYLNSAMVREVLGPNEAIISDVQYIYPEAEHIRNEPARHRIDLAKRQKQLVGQAYRVVGFDTSAMVPGKRWFGPDAKGIHIAVAASDPTHNFILVNFEKLTPVRTREFTEALTYVRLTPEDFIARARINRENKTSLAEGDIQTLIDLYVLYYNRFRVPRTTISSNAAVRPAPRPTPPAPTSTPETQPEPALPERITLDIPEHNDPPAQEPRDEPVDEPAEEPQPERHEPAAPPAEDDDWEPNDDGSDVPTFFGIPIE